MRLLKFLLLLHEFKSAAVKRVKKLINIKTMMTGKIPVILFCLLAFTSCSKDKLENVQITRETTLHSQIINDDYNIYFYLPSDYNENQKYPVIFLLDGDWHTKMVAKEINQLWTDNVIPECILAGIGNSAQRMRDYTYQEDKNNKGSGHADQYYKFIRDELIPYVDSNYSTDTTQRIIAGHSLGGFFVLYAMFRQNNNNELFSGFVAASPSIWWDNAFLLKSEKEYSETHTDLPVKLFLSAGSDEGITNMLNSEMRERLESRGYADFQTKQMNFENKGHEGASIPGFVEGIKFVLN